MMFLVFKGIKCPFKVVLKIFLSLYFFVYQRLINTFALINNYKTTSNNNIYTALINNYNTTLINNIITNII